MSFSFVVFLVSIVSSVNESVHSKAVCSPIGIFALCVSGKNKQTSRFEGFEGQMHDHLGHYAFNTEIFMTLRYRFISHSVNEPL